MNKKRATPDPYDVVRRLRYCTSHIAVGFSCGKDAATCAHLCFKWFDRVCLFYKYVIPDLSFHQQYIAYWESMVEEQFPGKLFGGKILQFPHEALSLDLRAAHLRDPLSDARNVPALNVRDTEVHVFKQTGINWFAYGQKKSDSLERRAMLNKDEGIIVASHRGFPIADWGTRSVTQYLRNNGIPLSPEYGWKGEDGNTFGASFGGQLEGKELKLIRDNSPSDYEKIVKRFPAAEQELFRYENIGGGMKARKSRV